MKRVFLSENQQKQIIEYTKPSLDDFISYQNLDLLVAAYDEETEIYLVCVEYVSNSLSTLGYDSYSYLLLTPSGPYHVHLTHYPGGRDTLSNGAAHLISNEKLQALIDCYHHPVGELLEMREKATEGIDLEGKSYSQWYLENRHA